MKGAEEYNTARMGAGFLQRITRRDRVIFTHGGGDAHDGRLAHGKNATPRFGDVTALFRYCYATTSIHPLGGREIADETA